MDPNTLGPEEHGHGSDGHPSRPRPSRDPLAPDLGQHATPVPARTAQLVTGDLLLTVNPVDGSEIELCPPAERPERPAKSTPAERTESARAARPPVPPGPASPVLGLVGRQEEREQLVRLLARGRSVRLTGPGGSGRTSLLDLVAEDCADLAPDGVVRLSGFHRTASELLYDLLYAVHTAPGHRPDQDELLALVREIGAVVVVDDLEFGGAALDELLEATPECAFLFAATPDVPAPSADSGVEEVVLGGLDRAGGIELIERSVGRVLTEDEANWAGDLWFESEGLPLRFVQAGALLRQRDRMLADAETAEDLGVFEDVRPADAPASEADTALPSLGEAAAPAPLLASRLSASARATLRFAVALGGEVPHQAHLPALVGDTHADAALGELADCGLVSPVGARYRLAAGVIAQLEAAGYADDLTEQARTAARHYTWWAGHPSVTPERVCAEADAVLAALSVLAPLATALPEDDEDDDAGDLAVQLARTAAPAFAAGLHWGAWERALRSGAEASRLAGQVADQAYFHHELGILALCGGRLDRARAELEASIGLRGALADKRGTVAGRRALALVADRAGDTPGLPVTGPTGATTGEEVPDARHDESASPPGGVPAQYPAPPRSTDVTAVVTRRPADEDREDRGGLRGLARRNLVAAGAGAMLVAVLGTVVTLGATSDNDPATPSDRVATDPSASQGVDGGALGADAPADDTENGDTGTATSRPTDPGPDGTYGTADDPTPTRNTPGPSESARPSGGGTSSSPKPTKTPGGGTSSGTTGGSTSGSPSGGTTTGGPTGGTTSGTTGGTADGGTSTGPTGGTTNGGTTTGGGSTEGGTDGGTADGGTTTGTTGGTTGTTGGTTGTTGGDPGDSTGGGTSSPSTSMSASAPESAGSSPSSTESAI
ncbi:ATP-binding protein [Streptomyces sp. XM83C]|uniref:ATP-binding protein n=1 Tax=Streptomyces sp. XM83C TaxID=2929781 RepID=UPI001FFBAFBC|nr:ATP-binding protein [Streptomyces sp. XM83C]MCK1819612.1 ATP-binding protein [Streptomyces sp. XM83C]